jgi:hypothetical protein
VRPSNNQIIIPAQVRQVGQGFTPHQQQPLTAANGGGIRREETGLAFRALGLASRGTWRVKTNKRMESGIGSCRTTE